MKKKDIMKKALEDLEDAFKFDEYLLNHPEIIEKLPEHIYVPSGVKISEILSPRRLELLTLIAQNPNINVNGLAKKLKRKKEAISRDLAILKRHNLINMERKGREKEVGTKVKYVLIPISA